MKSLQLCLLSLLLSACASVPFVENTPGRDSASLRGTRHGADSYYVSRVDARPVRRPVLESDWARPLAIPAGEKQLSIEFESTHPAFPSGLRGARAQVKVNLLPGISYAPDGRDEGRSVSIWIKRLDTGQRVTDEIIAKKDDLPPLRAPVVPNPIILPRTPPVEVGMPIIPR